MIVVMILLMLDRLLPRRSCFLRVSTEDVAQHALKPTVVLLFRLMGPLMLCLPPRFLLLPGLFYRSLLLMLLLMLLIVLRLRENLL